MTVEALLLAATTLIALIAVVVAVAAVRTVRRLSDRLGDLDTPAPAAPALDHRPVLTEPIAGRVEREALVSRPTELAPRVVQGRVVVPPSQAQVIRTALGRPGVRLNIFVHGLARVLRPENRDRIVALMRREYRHRRRERLRAGRRAVRVSRPTSAPSTERLHAEFAEPKSLSLTDRMISS